MAVRYFWGGYKYGVAIRGCLDLCPIIIVILLSTILFNNTFYYKGNLLRLYY